MRAFNGDLMFQHTAARRRLVRLINYNDRTVIVSTHSRPKAAGSKRQRNSPPVAVSTHSRPKAAGYFRRLFALFGIVSTHSRPKAAGALFMPALVAYRMFQHTATRRRLGY